MMATVAGEVVEKQQHGVCAHWHTSQSNALERAPLEECNRLGKRHLLALQSTQYHWLSKCGGLSQQAGQWGGNRLAGDEHSLHAQERRRPHSTTRAAEYN